MAHFAKIDSNNKVETVIVAPDQAYVDSLGGRWIQTCILPDVLHGT